MGQEVKKPSIDSETRTLDGGREDCGNVVRGPGGGFCNAVLFNWVEEDDDLLAFCSLSILQLEAETLMGRWLVQYPFPKICRALACTMVKNFRHFKQVETTALKLLKFKLQLNVVGNTRYKGPANFKFTCQWRYFL